MSDLTDQQKSVLLAKAMGWHPADKMTVQGHYMERYHDLYDPAKMHLAWRVMNWAMQLPAKPHQPSMNAWLFEWWYEVNLPNLPPAHAQRLWLDKIFALAVEAGIIESDIWNAVL